MADMDRGIKEAASRQPNQNYITATSEIVLLSAMISSLQGVILISLSAVKPGSVQIFNYDISSQIFED